MDGGPGGAFTVHQACSSAPFIDADDRLEAIEFGPTSRRSWPGQRGLTNPHAADHDGCGTGKHTRILQRIIVVGHDVALRVDAKEVTRS